VNYGENPLHLTPTEFRLLATLASEPEKVFSREELATRVWGYESIGESRVVDVHIRRLRQKLDEGMVVDPTIVTLRGFGYKLSSSGKS
jgi:two-component system OmpR family response regulator/two-component system alkaline phosphatase synthesis response regulator PhoP